IGGNFSALGNQVRNGIGRLNADGSVDATFNPAANSTHAVSVLSLAVQSDGKILIGGSFTNLGGQACANLARLNPDGTMDPSFNAGVPEFSLSYVRSIVVQADGRILVGGHFFSVDGQPRTNLARLNVDGTLDTAFNPGVNGYA